jgi:hypothetical protein
MRGTDGRFHFRRVVAMGTLLACGQAEVERQQTDWTGLCVCHCQQAGISLERPDSFIQRSNDSNWPLAATGSRYFRMVRFGRRDA